MLLLLQAEPLWAQLPMADEVNVSDVKSESVREDFIAGMPIETGWVVLDGEYIDPPYVISKQGKDVFFNNRRVMTQAENTGGGRERVRRGESRANGRGEQERRRQRGPAFGAARIEQQLIDGGLVVIVTDVGAANISCYGLPRLLKAIESDQSLADKVQALNGMVDRPVHSAVWLATIESYRPNAELSEIAAEVQAGIDERALEREQKFAGNSWFNWIMPMAAIGAVLLGVGVLLKAHRVGLKEPGGYRVWRHIDTSGLRSRMVLLLIGLLLLLNGLDLAFTLIAQQTGQFAELSPIGDRLITKPILLGLYKVAAVAIGAGLLLFLRQWRAAEVTAWWMCAVYVLVLVRWVAVNTLIMA